MFRLRRGFAAGRGRLKARLIPTHAKLMLDTGDPLLDGPVPAPAGARINAQDQVSASSPTFVVEAQIPATAP